MYGTIVCLSGLVNLSQPLIDAAIHEVFHDNPIPINVVFACLGLLVGVVLVTFVWMQDHKIHNKEARVREATERDRLIPEVEEDEYDY